MRHSRRLPRIAVVLSLLILALAAAPPAAAAGAAHTKLKFPPLPEFKIDTPEVYSMANGMKVFLMEDHELPLINLSMRIRTGSNFEPANKVGLAEIFGQVMREGGTASMSGEEIDTWLAARAATVETSIGGDVGFASANCLKENFDEVLGVLDDILRNPAFAEDKLEVARSQANAAISRRNDNVGGITSREFSRLIYGEESPLARLTEYETLAAITRSDLVAWHKRFFHPNNIYVGVVGDFDSKAMKRRLNETFGDWKKGPDFSPPEVPYQREMQPGTYLIEKDDVTQANVRLGHLGIGIDNPDYFATQVLNDVLGGSWTSRLRVRLRTEQGLAYSVFGSIGAAFKRQGIFQVGLSTKSETMAAAVESLKTEVKRIITEPPTREELTVAKESILNSFIFNYASKAGILGQIMLYDYYGLPSNFLQTYRANIEKVTVEDVARVARTYIHPDKLTLLVVGKPAAFDKPVDTFGEVATLNISIPPPPDSRPQIARSAESLEAGKKLFTRAARAITNGSAEKMKSLKTSVTIDFDMGGQTMQIGQDLNYVAPDLLHQTVKTPMGNQVIVLNGDKGVMKMGGQSQTVPSERIADSFEQFRRDLIVLADHADNPGLEAILAGTGDVGGKPCELLSVTFEGTESRLCVAADGKVLSQSYQGKHPMRGTPGLIEVLFSDYANSAGRLLPQMRVLSFEGERLATIKTDSLEINPVLDKAQFELSSN